MTLILWIPKRDYAASHIKASACLRPKLNQLPSPTKTSYTLEILNMSAPMIKVAWVNAAAHPADVVAGALKTASQDDVCLRSLL